MSNLWITPEELGDYAESEFAYEAAKAASNILWALSGRKYSGVTTVTERYVCATLAYRYGSSSRNTRADLVLGDVYNMPYSDMDSYTAVTTDGLSPQSRLRLRGRPITKIHAMRNRAGVIINPNSYYLVDHSTIQSVAGSRWSPCDSEITYTYGIEPPTMGKMAARVLAMEFCKLWNGDDDCILPQRVTSVSRQGVSYTILDSQDFIDDMRTGLYSIDLFLKSVNPDKARNKARVFSPDVPRGRRYTPKSLKYGASDLDMSVSAATSTGEVEVSLDAINAGFLSLELGWTPYLILRNYAETTSSTLMGSVTMADPTASVVSVSNKSLTSNVATLTTSAAHNIVVGSAITVAGVGVPFNGDYTVVAVPTATTLTYARTNANIVSAVATGTVTAPTDDVLTLTVTYDQALAVIGKVDPGSYDLYADRANGAETETVYISSGNLSIALADTSINAYTLG